MYKKFKYKLVKIGCIDLESDSTFIVPNHRYKQIRNSK